MSRNAANAPRGGVASVPARRSRPIVAAYTSPFDAQPSSGFFHRVCKTDAQNLRKCDPRLSAAHVVEAVFVEAAVVELPEELVVAQAEVNASATAAGNRCKNVGESHAASRMKVSELERSERKKWTFKP